MQKLNIIDMFCGGGGESTGLISAAHDYDFDVNLSAINHWERAIETHAANYPFAAHHIKVMEEEIDKVHKVSIYLIGNYKKELIEEFKVKVTSSKEDFFKTGIFNTVPTDSSDAMYEAHVIMEIFDRGGR